MKKTACNVLTNQLIRFLNDMLPKISETWWESLVIEKLTSQQQSFAKLRNANAIEQLALAALLRVAEQKWYELSQLLSIGKIA